MKVNEFVNAVAFSHRPQDGISVGVAVIAGVAYLSGGFVRTGDSFNRGLARRILTQRIISTLEKSRPVPLVGVVENVPAKVDARSVMREFRKLFKPDPLCNDDTFATTSKLGEVAFRSQLTRDASWKKVTAMFDAAVKNAIAGVTV